MPESQQPKRGELQLDCGTTISLSSLEQSLTYEGLLEGCPNRELNQRLVERLCQRLEQRSGRKPLLIPPIECEVREEDAAGEVVMLKLPRIQCTAWFRSRTFGEFGSQVAVLWFQDEFAFPIDPTVESHIRRMSWVDHAQPLDDF